MPNKVQESTIADLFEGRRVVANVHRDRKKGITVEPLFYGQWCTEYFGYRRK